MDDGDPEPGGHEPGADPARGRFEKAISLAAPLLDLVLAVGERISRIAEPVDYEYYPVRGDSGRESNRPGDEDGQDHGR